MDTRSIRTPTPEVLPGDTLETHYSSLERMRPHGCYEGFLYIGHMVEDEGGDPTEEIERVPCRRCHTGTRYDVVNRAGRDTPSGRASAF